MSTIASFTQFENGTTGHHFTAVTNKRRDDVFQVHDLRLTMVQCHHVNTERNLQLGLGVEVVEHHFTDRIAFDFNHDAHTVFVRLVTQRADAFHAFFFYQFRNFFDQARFVHLIRNFVDDNGFTSGFGVNFYFGTGTDIYLAATGTVSFFNTATTVNDCRRREVRPRDVFHQPFNADVFIIDIRQTTVDDFRQVVRRDVGCHTYGDTGRTVHQQVRNFGWHDVGNFFRAVIVINEIDRLFFEIGHQFMGNFRQTDFRITHCRRRVAVDGTEVTLTVYQHVTQREWLRHTDDRVINRQVTMGMVFTDYVTNDTGRFFIGFVPVIA